MTPHLARHEQFLRIFAVLEILTASRQTLDDQALIIAVKERLGLSQLSTRTLRRDCNFLVSCGYHIDHLPLQGDRRHGWRLTKTPNGKPLPAEPLTLLELLAFSMGRDLLRTIEGTVIWTGIESLKYKLTRELPAVMLEQLQAAKKVFQVVGSDPDRYADRPRLISTLSNAITECREIELDERKETGGTVRHRLQPHRLVIRSPTVHLLSFVADAAKNKNPLLLDINRIEKVTPLDVTFVPRLVAEV